MVNFTYYNPTKIIFGKDVIASLGKTVKGHADKVLLHYGGGSIKRNGVYDAAVKSLKDAGVEFVELGGVQPNPRLKLVKEGIEICRKHGIKMVLAVGGGSTIDSAKAIATGVPYEGDMWEDMFMNGLSPKAAIGVGVVLTIPAAGSESSDSMVISNDYTGHKRAVSSDLIYPKFAFLDPQSTFTMPKYQIACGASDILAHLFERYFTPVKNVDFIDRMIEANMRTILINTPMAIDNQNDYNVRAEIMWAGTIAHNNILSTGRIGDWATHSIEHELSAKYDIAHGAGLAIMFPAWMKYVYKTDINRFLQLSVRVFDIDLSYAEPDKIIAAMIDKLKDWYMKIGLKTSLTEVNIPASDFKFLAKNCLVGRKSIGEFVKLKASDVEAIYNLAK